MTRRLLAASLAALCLAATAAVAQTYPTKPVKIVVPFAPGGNVDVTARIIAPALQEALGQPVVVENRTGANGNTAAEMVATAPADGYTLILAADSLIAINPHLYKRMPIDPMKDLAPVASMVTNQFVLSVNPSLPVKTLPEFIEHARKSNPPLHYASGGNGSQHQLTMEMLKQRAGIDLVHVPYRGGAPATTATVAGEVAAMFAGTSTAPQIKAGRLRALAVAGAKRSPSFPELPTISEFYPGFENSIWLGLFGPVGLPEEVLSRLRKEVNQILAQKDVQERLLASGSLEPFITTPEEFAAVIRRDYAKYGKVIKEAGIKAD